jgi:hypothetical protein
LLETGCDRLWVVVDGLAVGFDGGYRAWRAAIAEGWTTRHASSEAKPPPKAPPPKPVTPARPRARPARLSKDAYRKQRAALDAELTRLGLRKNHLELAMGDPTVAANFVELRRVTSELADVTEALAVAEDAWLELEERAP